MIATRYNSVIIFLLLFLSVRACFSQNIDFKSSNFKLNKADLKKAVKNIKIGDEFLEKK